jgi:hypothetical protein
LYLDKVEELYNNMLKEYQSRKWCKIIQCFFR